MNLRFILGTRVIDVDPLSGYFEAVRITRSEKRGFGIKPCAVCASYNIWMAPVSNWEGWTDHDVSSITFRPGIKCGRCGRRASCGTMTETIMVWNFRVPGKKYPPVPGPRKRRAKWDDDTNPYL